MPAISLVLTSIFIEIVTMPVLVFVLRALRKLADLL